MDRTRLDPPRARPEQAPDTPEPFRWQVAVGVVLVAGVLVRFITRSDLWLDEALTVNISRLPLGDIPEALRHDGAPPLYYYLLHGWMDVFGTSTFAVRALSGLFGVAALPLAWLAGRRLGGQRMAWAALVLLAANPFAVRYATEVRMYSLLMVLALVGFIAAQELLTDGPRRRWASVALAVATGLSLLTHYWTLYLAAAAAVAFLVVARRGGDEARAGARRALVSMGAGGLLFLPWLPSFVYQLRHTGTPWGESGSLRSLFDVVFAFGGGASDAGLVLGLLLLGLVALALFGSPLEGGGILLQLRRCVATRLSAIAFGAVALAILAGIVGDTAFAARYAAGVFPLVLLAAALGTEVFTDRRAHRGVLAVAVVLGFWATFPNIAGERTSAGRVASFIEAAAQPGDVVVYCPDQLGPSVSRELDTQGLVQLTFPRATSPEFVNWVDYADVNRAADTADFTQLVLRRAGPDHDIWVVWAGGYRTFASKCSDLVEKLGDARPDNQILQRSSLRYFERPALVRFPA